MVEEESLPVKLNKYKIPLILCLVGVVLIVGGLFSSNLLSTPISNTAKETSLPKKSVVTAQSINPEIKVDLSGAVKNPGVYSLPQDSRIEDVIKLSQGFLASASAEFINKTLNLSQKLSDGQKIYIPFEGEAFQLQTQVAGISTSQNSKIGINSASASDLDKLPSVGPATSQKIITNRPYQTLEDLLNKKVISKSVYSKIKDLIDLN